MEILLAAPGTGKTTKTKAIIDERFKDASNILILSFTNATVNDLNNSFERYDNVHCYTLHKYALLINHLPEHHILSKLEITYLEKFSEKLNVNFNVLCETLRCMTFDMMISGSITFIRSNPIYAESRIGHIDLLIVDEFQDFNETERSLLELLYEYASDVIILGDDDQSIYGFKNADPEALIGIYNSEDSLKIPHEHICYRCPDEVVSCSSNLIRMNTTRIDKEWHLGNKKGEVQVLQGKNQEVVNAYIIKTLNELRRDFSDESVLILSSVKIATLPVLRALDENGIGYTNFMNKDLSKSEFYLIWWLRAIYGTQPFLNVVFLLCHFKLHSKVKLIEKFKDYIKNTSLQNELLSLILSYEPFKIPLSEYLNTKPDLNIFFKDNPEFVIFRDYIDESSLSRSIEEIVKNYSESTSFDNHGINAMTIHKSKGLQADNVFILGLTEGLFPNKKEGTDNIESQRRVLFVGMTRALKRLWLISCIEWDSADIQSSMADKSQFGFKGRQIMTGRMSSFIDEMGLRVKPIR